MNLTPVELDVLAGTANGETAIETGKRMFRSVWTIKQHRKAILAKLGVPNAAAAVHRAHELGLLGHRANPEQLPLTEGQRRAFHAKCSDLDVAHELNRRSTKKRVLGDASQRFGRLIESANDLSRGEADVVLEQLERELDSIGGEDQLEPAATTAGATTAS